MLQKKNNGQVFKEKFYQTYLKVTFSVLIIIIISAMACAYLKLVWGIDVSPQSCSKLF